MELETAGRAVRGLGKFIVTACALAASLGIASAEGNRSLCFVQSQSGQVDVATASMPTPASWIWNAVDQSWDGQITLSGVPAGAQVRVAYFYYTSSSDMNLWRPTWAKFAGNGVPIYITGLHQSWLGAYYVMRADVTDYLQSNGTFSLGFGAPGQKWTPDSAALLVVYEHDSVAANYQVEIADGANAVVHVGLNDIGPSPNPLTFTGFVVDPTAPTVGIRNLTRYLVNGRAAYYTLNGTIYSIISHYPPTMFSWEPFDLSSSFAGGETQAQINIGEGTQARVVWCASILRVRTGPLITDTTPPELAIALPGDGDVVAATPITVSVSVRDESGTSLSSNPPLIWNPPTLPPETMGYSEAEFALLEGPNTVTVTATDEVGLSTSDTVTVRLDTLAPEVTITSPLDGAVVSSTPLALRALVLDASVSWADVPAAGIVDLELPAGGAHLDVDAVLLEGPNDLTVSSTDEAGHTGGDSITVVLDSLPPVVTISSPPEDFVLGDTPVVLSIDVVDATKTTVSFGGNEVLLGEGGGTVSGPVELVSGSNTIAVVATDQAGNTTTELLHLILDLEAPIVTIDWPAEGECFGPGQATIVVLATVDDLTATNVQSTPPGISTWLPAGGGIASGAIDLVEGLNPIRIDATDQIGRTGSASRTVVLDRTPPTLVIDAPADGSALRGVVDFAATAVDVAPGSGVARVDFAVDGSVVAALVAPPFEVLHDTTTLLDGLHTLAVTAEDGEGNSASAHVDVLVDNTVPQVQIVTPLDGAILGGAIDFDASALDTGSGLSSVHMFVGSGRPNVRDDSVDFATPVASTWRSSREDTSPPWHLDGPLTLSVRALDAAGNEAFAYATVQVDNTAPGKTILAPADGDVVRGLLTISTAAEDPNLATLAVQVDGQTIGTSWSSPYDVVFDTTTRLDGAMVITVVATDVVGNSSSCSVHVTADNVTFRLDPQSLNLKSKGKENSVTAHLEGASVELLLPTESHAIQLRIPGGNPVPATSGWPGDDTLSDSDGDGVPELTVKFDRQQLIASVKAALAAGFVGADGTIPCALYADGGFELGSDLLKIAGK